jgi:hypothetical protein
LDGPYLTSFVDPVNRGPWTWSTMPWTYSTHFPLGK